MSAKEFLDELKKINEQIKADILIANELEKQKPFKTADNGNIVITVCFN